MNIQIPDVAGTIIVAAVGALATIGGAYFGLRSKRVEIEATREATFAEMVDQRIKIILDAREKDVSARDKHIDELKTEVHSLNIKLDGLIEIIRTVITNGRSCPRSADGGCPIDHSDLAGRFAAVISGGRA
jgi:hypothetical protein